MKLITTACPRNCYSTCSMMVRVDDGKVTGIEPHPDNPATPEGPCIKGLAYVERANSEQRILFPLIKNKNGKFERIGWKEALQRIAGNLKQLRTESGPHSVLFYASSGMSGLLNEVSFNFWKMFGGATTTYGNLCWPAGLEATRLTLGENSHNDPWDLENAKLIILWGKNPAETNIQEMIPIRKSFEKGGKLIVIDPRRTVSSENADMLVQIKPGTDAALALGIAAELIRTSKIDHEFIRNNVIGFDEFKERALQYNPKKVAGICGIPETGISQLAKLIATSHPMTIIPGYGMQRYQNGGQTTRCILALSVLTGNIGKPGGCWHYANLQSYVFDYLKEPLSYYPGCEHPVFRRKVSMARPGEDILKLNDPPVRMIWVERGNPLTQNPDIHLTRKAFRKAEFRVVVEQFMTDTALEADIILPAKNMFEQTDIIGSYWNPYVQLRQKAVAPPPEVRPETEIYWHLAHELGFSEEEIKRNIPEPGDESVEAWLNQKLQSFPEITLDQLRKGPILANSHQSIPFSDLIFPTPSGKIELLSTQATELWGVDPLPDYLPLQNDTIFPLQLLSPNSKNRIHSQFGNLKIIRQFEPEALLFIHPDDAGKRAIQHLETAILFNDKGSAEIIVSFDYGMRRGCVTLTNGHWAQHGATPNLFTTGRFTDMGYGTAFHDTFVELRKK